MKKKTSASAIIIKSLCEFEYKYVAVATVNIVIKSFIWGYAKLGLIEWQEL